MRQLFNAYKVFTKYRFKSATRDMRALRKKISLVVFQQPKKSLLFNHVNVPAAGDKAAAIVFIATIGIGRRPAAVLIARTRPCVVFIFRSTNTVLITPTIPLLARLTIIRGTLIFITNTDLTRNRALRDTLTPSVGCWWIVLVANRATPGQQQKTSNYTEAA
jgi:hypothetical protein